jgi:hypothetical protein
MYPYVTKYPSLNFLFLFLHKKKIKEEEEEERVAESIPMAMGLVWGGSPWPWGCFWQSHRLFPLPPLKKLVFGFSILFSFSFFEFIVYFCFILKGVSTQSYYSIFD